MPIADDPTRAHDVVLRGVGDGDVAGSFRLAIYAKRRECLIFVVHLGGTIEHIVGAYMHEGQIVLGGHFRQQRRAKCVGLPRRHTPFGRLGLVHRRECPSIDDRAVQAPVIPLIGGRIRKIEFVDVGEFESFEIMLFNILANRLPKLAVRTGDQCALRIHWLGILEHRVMQVRFGEFGLLKRNRPLDVEFRVGQVHEGVCLLLFERPMRVHQIRVGRAILQRLEAVAHPARHIYRLRRVKARRIHLPEGVTRTQIHPGTEDLAGGQRDELVPWLGVDATGHTAFRIETDIVLYRLEVLRQAECRHLRLLPVLFEPAAVIAVHRQIEDQQAGNIRLRDLEFLFKFHSSRFPHHCCMSVHDESAELRRIQSIHWPWALYLASVAAFAGSHHCGLSMYHCTV